MLFSNYRYLEDNLRLSDRYRKYHDDIPGYLRDRPRFIVKNYVEKHFLAECIPADHVTIIDPVNGVFQVRSQNIGNVVYTVSFGSDMSMPNWEGCPDWEKRDFLVSTSMLFSSMCPDGSL